jgi:hypothetical protein
MLFVSTTFASDERKNTNTQLLVEHTNDEVPKVPQGENV